MDVRRERNLELPGELVELVTVEGEDHVDVVGDSDAGGLRACLA
jgi:hypothetical protein